MWGASYSCSVCRERENEEQHRLFTSADVECTVWQHIFGHCRDDLLVYAMTCKATCAFEHDRFRRRCDDVRVGFDYHAFGKKTRRLCEGGRKRFQDSLEKLETERVCWQSDWLGYVIGLMHCCSSSRSCLFALQLSALLETYSTFRDFAFRGTDLCQRHVQRRLSLGRNAVLRALPQHPQ